MNSTDWKKLYGPEYPEAIVRNGLRFPLASETTFSRTYRRETDDRSWIISKFMDGSANISSAELRARWPLWSASEKADFCEEFCHISGQRDIREMLRFVMKNGSVAEWSALAQDIAGNLPNRESFAFLCLAIKDAPPMEAVGLAQGIALTRHPEAKGFLRLRVAGLLAGESAWLNDPFMNGEAFAAICTIQDLLEDFGVLANEFDNEVARLAVHDCKGVVQTCKRRLSKHYPRLAGKVEN